MTDIPAHEPDQIRAGDTVKWTRSLDDYPAPTWVLTYYLTRQGAMATKVTATDNGDGEHIVAMAPADTEKLGAGEWQWQAKVSDGTDVYTIDTGIVEVIASFESGGVDPRTWAKKMLAAVEDVLLNKANKSVLAGYSYAGRSLQYRSLEELVTIRSKLRAEVNRDDRAAGLKKRPKVLTRMRSMR